MATMISVCFVLLSLLFIPLLQIEGQSVSSAGHCNLVFIFESDILYLRHTPSHGDGIYDILTEQRGRSLYEATATTAVLGDGQRGQNWDFGNKYTKEVVSLYPTYRGPCDDKRPNNDWKAIDGSKDAFGMLLGSLHNLQIDDTKTDNCAMKYGHFINPIYITLSVVYISAAECYRDYDYYYRKLDLDISGFFYEQTKSRCHWVYHYDGIEEYDSATAAADDPLPTVVICKTKESQNYEDILDKGCVLEFKEPNYENTISVEADGQFKSSDPMITVTQEISDKANNIIDFNIRKRNLDDSMVKRITIKLNGFACVGPNIPEVYVDTLSALERTDNVYHGCELESGVFGFQGKYSLDLEELRSTGIVIMTNDDTSSKKVQFFSGLLKFTFQEKEHYVKTSFDGNLCLGEKEYSVNDDLMIKKPEMDDMAMDTV